MPVFGPFNREIMDELLNSFEQQAQNSVHNSVQNARPNASQEDVEANEGEEEIVFTAPNGHTIENIQDFPMPLAATREGLVKRDDDVISGNESFIVTVSYNHFCLPKQLPDVLIFFDFVEKRPSIQDR